MSSDSGNLEEFKTFYMSYDNKIQALEQLGGKCNL